MPETASAEYTAFWRTLNAGRYVTGRFRRIDSQGREIWLEASHNPVHDASGKLVKVVKFATVVTAQVEREQAVRQAANMALDISRRTDASASDGVTVMQGMQQAMQNVASQLHCARRYHCCPGPAVDGHQYDRADHWGHCVANGLRP